MPRSAPFEPLHRWLHRPASFWHQVESRCLMCGDTFLDVAPAFYCSLVCSEAGERAGWPHRVVTERHVVPRGLVIGPCPQEACVRD